MVYHEGDREEVEKVFVRHNKNWSLEWLDFLKVMRVDSVEALMIINWEMDERERKGYQILIKFETIEIENWSMKVEFIGQLE